MKVFVHAQDVLVDLPPAIATHLLAIGAAHRPDEEDPRKSDKATEDAPENQARKGKRSRKSK